MDRFNEVWAEIMAKIQEVIDFIMGLIGIVKTPDEDAE